MVRMIVNIFISIILLVGSIFGLAGCGNSNAGSAPETAAAYDQNEKKPLIGSTVMVALDAALKENLSDTWDEIIFYKGNAVKVSDALILYRGNIVKVLDTSDSWLYVEAVDFVPPANKGYISAHAVLTGFSDSEANQGFIIDKAIAFSEPTEKAKAINDSVTGPVNIKKRENGWAFCGFTGGQEDGWIKEEQIRYYFEESE